MQLKNVMPRNEMRCDVSLCIYVCVYDYYVCLYVCLCVSINVSMYAHSAMLCHDTDGEHNENMHVPTYVSTIVYVCEM